ncbi:M15 family metallopeptidase [Brevundimonas naejangsanensis]|uniref:M15 family metallopeptidase n=1 Tax=Brevundimonas naejangsanensis TaxID=588932 RepID=UPI00106A71CB|nr:M15 family metallopeptidase [Brevundimonas naejangsanensis]QBQ47973.1 D-alanyl-D-alanine carboxypeptidase [Brevundimonas naejangsanensis]
MWKASASVIAALAAAVAGQAYAEAPEPAPTAQICDRAPGAWDDTAQANAISLYALEWVPFGPSELGWEAYVPLIQHKVGSPCDPTSAGFAEALAGFQGRYGLAASGRFDQATFQVLRGLWQERRPFVMVRVRGECPDPPPVSDLAYLTTGEEHAERLTRLLRRDVLDAYRAMATAARAEVPEIAAEPELLRVFSSFRDPEADAARCARDGNCDGLRRAVCSPHRTGTAVDLYVGHLQGMGVDSTDVHSRRHMSQTPTYRWLVKNAGRFGFVPYVYEPWHWEWVGR